MQDYVPSAYRTVQLAAGDLRDLTRTERSPVIVRRAQICAIGPTDSTNTLQVSLVGLDQPVALDVNRAMRFGTEAITIGEYLDRVIELDDLVDIIADRRYTPPITYLWIHIEYLDEPLSGVRFSRKDDGLFALRAKAGEKAERIVANELVARFHHCLSEDKLKGSGTFQISYKGKKVRTADLTCTKCNLSVEVKKRNRDRRYRVSHSPSRPFDRENATTGWHAIVFPDMSVHWIPNRTISACIREGTAYLGSDQYDSWAELDPSRACEADPPLCTHG